MLKITPIKKRGGDIYLHEYKEVNRYEPNTESEVAFINNCIKELNNTIALANYYKDTSSEDDMIYKMFKIPKKTGGYREINAPTDTLKDIQNSIVILLRDVFQMRESNNAYAYVRKKSTFTSRIKHRDNKSKWFLKVDISNFFPSCSKELVCSKLLDIYPIAVFPEKHKRAFKELISAYCFLNGGLPQGSPSSPFISNLIFIDFDLKISKMLHDEQKGFIYTRYCDDLEISHKKNFKYKDIVDKVGEIIKPYTIKHTKTRYGNNNVQGVWGLGILYNSSGEFSLGKENKMDLQHAILNTIATVNDGSDMGADFANVWLGKINYFKQINETQTNNIINKYNNKFNFNMIDYLKAEVRKK